MRRSLGAEIRRRSSVGALYPLSSAACADMPTTLRVGLLPGEAALTVIRSTSPYGPI